MPILRALSELRRLSPTDRRLHLRAAATVVAAKLALAVVRYRRVGPWVERRAIPRRRPVSVAFRPEEVGRAVSRAGRAAPFDASCLVQALATRWILGRSGFDARLRLGAARDPAGAMSAHAWVECEGRVVVGGENSLVELTPFDETAWERSRSA
jgi:hypothetical protein